MRDFTVIIPTWNQGRFLQPLFDSIVQSDFAASVAEIIFVCDRSTDGSEEIISRLIETRSDALPKVRMIQPERRQGLAIARYLGAKAALTTKIFFIDSRITLPQASGRALPALTRQYPAMVANVDIDETKNIYCLYWKRTHARLFHTTTGGGREAVTVTADNFNRNRVGGTCFYCSRDPFLRLSELHLDRATLFSDDTYIFADLVKSEPLTVHPDFRINWEPRDQAWVFLKHLYGRGPGFAQYNLFRHRGPLFWAVLSGTLLSVLMLTLLMFKPVLAVALAIGSLVALMFSTAFFAAGLGEFLKLAPLHAAVILFYGFGAVRGAWVVWRRRGTVPAGGLANGSIRTR